MEHLSWFCGANIEAMGHWFHQMWFSKLVNNLWEYYGPLGYTGYFTLLGKQQSLQTFDQTQWQYSNIQ